MEPETQWVNTPPLATSQYSGGGSLAPTPVNNYNNPTINPSAGTTAATNYGLTYYQPQAVAPQTNQSSQQGFSSSLTSPSTFKSAGQFFSGGGNSPITTAVNSVGSDLGFGSGLTSAGTTPAEANFLGTAAQSAGIQGPIDTGLATGSLTGSTATLSGTLEAGGLGALAGNFLGRIGGNSTGGSIGGGIGAAIGNVLFPGVGGIVGGLIGGIGGGFFGGNKPATQADFYSQNINPDGTLTYKDSGSKNPGTYAGYGEAVTNTFGQLTQAASKELGIKFNTNTDVGAGISTLHGGASINDASGNQIFYDVNDPKSQEDAFRTALQSYAALSGYTDTDKLNSWFDSKLASNTNTANSISATPNVPLNQSQFSDYMNKFNTQGSTNATT